MDSNINVNVNKNIPDHWKWVTLDDIGIVVSGGTPSTKEPEFWNGDIPWITPADLSDYDEVYISKGRRNISQVGLEYSSAHLLPVNSVVFSSRAPIGYVAITKNELATNQGFKNLILPIELVNPKYVYYYLKTVKELAENMASGTTFLEISANKFRQIPFPLAPIEEQNRIVEKLEELFSEIDDFKKNVIENKKKLNNHRQLIIFDIFKENSNYRQKGTWVKYTLSEIYNFIGGGTPSKKKSSYWGDGYNWASVKDINKIFLYETIDKITEEGVKNSSTNIAKKNEIILVTRISPGKVTIAGNDIAINQDLKIVKLKNVKINFLFTYYMFLYLENEILSLSKGTTVKGIQLAELNKIKVNIPDLNTQKYIVEIIESQISQNAILEKSINTEIERLDTLNKKIIEDAFKGVMSEKLQSDSSIEILLKEIEIKKEKYLKEQQELIKTRPKIKRMEKDKLSIIQVLEKNKNPISAKQLWEDSMYSNSIEEFYLELKKVQDRIIEKKTEKGSLISLK
ncbi:MAG TPA: restriction endonuclease subunit S [Saprospiraceae bacterium]|jgi:type I restriction enzyme S subunit|nr:restriction endonuclease subunit S [Saprospiraceae bacterium]